MKPTRHAAAAGCVVKKPGLGKAIVGRGAVTRKGPAQTATAEAASETDDLV